MLHHTPRFPIKAIVILTVKKEDEEMPSKKKDCGNDHKLLKMEGCADATLPLVPFRFSVCNCVIEFLPHKNEVIPVFHIGLTSKSSSWEMMQWMMLFFGHH